MKIFAKIGIPVFLALAVHFVFIPTPHAAAYSNPAAVPLLTVSDFAALGHTTITSPTGPTVLNNGDMGISNSPGACTGFPSPCTASGNGTINNGTIEQANGVTLQGQTDATAAVTNIGLRTSDQTIAGGLLNGLTLTQGVYTVPATTTNLTGDLTLSGDADSVFIFHATSTLVTASTSRVLLTGGVQACNVFWKVDSSATFNGGTTMVGTVFSAVSTTFSGPGATLAGRVIAQTGAITFNNTTVNNSSCAIAAASPAAATTSTPVVTTDTSDTKLPDTGLFSEGYTARNIALTALFLLVVAVLITRLVIYLKSEPPV